MSEKASKIISIVSTVVIIILVIFAAIVSFVFHNAKQSKDVPSMFGYTAFAIQTDSMEDKIKEGDFILTKKCDTSVLQIDDIITFYTVNNDGKPFINTHRIVDVIETESGRLFVTKGDNSPDNDPRKVYEGDVIAQYHGFRIPVLGYIITFLSTQLGFFLCIVLPVLLYTIWEIYKLIAIVMHNKKVEMLKEVQEETPDSVKEAIIAEYLAKQKEEEDKKGNTE